MSSDRSTFLRTLMQVTGEKKIHECFPLGDVWDVNPLMPLPPRPGQGGLRLLLGSLQRGRE